VKAILIDDERHARNLMRKIVDWPALGIEVVLEATDGETAEAMIERDKPEIIITDMKMPIKDGVSLLKWLQEQTYSKKVIVVSGYTEFHYMQKTIQYGGFDYLVKPVDEEKLTELLKTAIDALKEDAEKRQRTLQNEIRVNEVTPMYWSHLLTELVEHPETYKKAQNKLKEDLGIHMGIGGADYSIAMISFVPGAEHIEEKFSGNIDLLYFVILNIVNEIMSLHERGIAFRYLGKSGRILVLLKNSTHHHHEWRRIYEEIYRIYKVEVEIYLGSSIQALHEMQEIYKAMEDIFEQRNLLKNRAAIYTMDDIEKMAWLPLADQESNLIIALKSGNISEIERFIEMLFWNCVHSGILQRKQIQLWEAELNFLKKRMVERYAGSTVELKSWNPQGGFSLEVVKKCLFDELKETAHLLTEQHEAGRNIVFEVRSYIDEHYANPINVKFLAKTFHLNPEHLSRIFKQKYQIQIKDYITEIRIAKAKILLESQNLRINEISSIIGFNDEKYFSKVFRKHVGMTPKEFKLKNDDA
jgi:two-component system response regulator YesN